MSTTINLKNYNWTVTNAVARTVNPFGKTVNHPGNKTYEDFNKAWNSCSSLSPGEAYNDYCDDLQLYEAWKSFEDEFGSNILHTNAPNGQYPGDAFDAVWQSYENDQWKDAHPEIYEDYTWDTFEAAHGKVFELRISLRIKRSHLPQVLKEADYNSWTEGGELKELYKEVWKYRYINTETWIEEWPSTYKNFDNNFDQYIKADKTGRFEYSREYRLTNTPAVQKAETVEDTLTNLKAENAVLKVNQKKHKIEIADLNKQVEALKAELKEKL